MALSFRLVDNSLQVQRSVFEALIANPFCRMLLSGGNRVERFREAFADKDEMTVAEMMQKLAPTTHARM